MKYWILTTEYPPFYGGGISTYCYHTAHMLLHESYSVTIFIADKTIQDFRIQSENSVRVIRFGINRSEQSAVLGHTARQSFEYAMIVKEMIRQEGKPDIIESQDYLGIAYFIIQFKALLYPELQGVPILLSLHSPAFLYLEYNRDPVYEFPTYWTGEMEKSCLRSADILLGSSHHMVEEIVRRIPINKKIEIVRNPFEFVNTGGKGWETPGDQIIFYGKLTPQKGIFKILDYFAELWEDGFEHPLTLVGGADKLYYPEKSTVDHYIRKKYRPYFLSGMIRTEGKIKPSDTEAALSSAKIILVPSIHDNLPYAAIQAMSMGKVVLVSSEGGQAEMIDHGLTGFIFDHNIPDDFKEKLKYILSLSAGQIQAIGEAAENLVKKLFNYKTIFSEKMQVIHSMILKTKIADPLFPFIRDIDAPYTKPVKESEKNNLLSVIIPYFEMEDYVQDCILSVLASTWTNFEIIIVDDGSKKQQSIEVLSEIAEKYPVRIVTTANQGVAKARNRGAVEAKGYYISFLDADDKVAPDYYLKAIAVLDTYKNVVFVGSWAQYFENSDAIWPAWNPEPPYILAHNCINSSALVYKKHAFLAAGQNDTLVGYGLEDYESVIHLLAEGFRGVVLPEPLFLYRIRANSMSGSMNRYKAMYSHQYIAAKHKSLFARYASELYNILNANGPSLRYDNPTIGLHVTTKKVNMRAMEIIKRYAGKNIFIKNLAMKARSFF